MENVSVPEVAVSMRGVTKRFPGVLANENVDLTVRHGEIHALLGENGAGKSTLMNVLAGLYQPDEGQLFIQGRQVQFHSPRDAIDHGIGMVHQHFMLVQTLTVIENILLGLREASFVLDPAGVGGKISDLSERYHLNVDPNAYIWQLSVGEQQRVEILKLLYRGADVLILDEPTAVLTPQESEDLAVILRQMTDERKAIIFITHKLDEVMAFSDRVTVLRRGKLEATLDTKASTKAELAKLMVGRDVLFRLDKNPCQAGDVVLEIKDLVALNDKGMPALQGINLALHRGEILGIAGVAGNGQRELAETITGLRRAESGSILVDQTDIINQSPRQMIAEGIRHIPGDRLGMGLVPNLPIADNSAMKAYRHPPMARGPLLDHRAMLSFAKRLIKAFEIRTPNAQTPARLLSGGNQQKVVLAREISARGDILVAVYPTRGLDVGATESVRGTLLAQRDAGAAILLISEDLDELLQLSDRIAVLFEGQVMGVVDSEAADREQLGLMMAGQRAEQLHAEPVATDSGKEGLR